MITFKKLCLFVAFMAFSVILRAEENPQHSFEGAVPDFVSTSGNSSAVISAERFKDGRTSLKFSWSGEAGLTLSTGADIEASMKVPNAGIVVWIYNPVPCEDGVLRFSFRNADEGEICFFNFNMGFKGWRVARVRYVDMHTDEGYYGDIPAGERAMDVAKMTVTPVGIDEGVIYVDRLSFRVERQQWNSPDKQIPDNDHLNTNLQVPSSRRWDWEQYPPLKVVGISEEEGRMLDEIAERVDRVISSEAYMGVGGRKYVESVRLPQAEEMYRKYGLERQADGTVLGAPLLSNTEASNERGEIQIEFIGQVIFWYALDYYYTGNKANLDKVFTAMDHIIEQGFAYGCNWETHGVNCYRIRFLYWGLWILRREVAEAGKLDEYLKVMEYWAGLAETRLPFNRDRIEILDTWHTLNLCKVISVMMNPDPNVRYAKMAALAQWLSGSIIYTPGVAGGIKVDGTTFHHWGMYPAYTVGAFAALGEWCYFTKDTPFALSEDARRCLKFALLSMRNYCNLTDWGLAVCGRHPFSGRISLAAVKAYATLALLGDLTGSGKVADSELGGAYLELGGDTDEFVTALEEAGISASPAPEGFFVMNYGAFGVHRRDNWMLSVKAFNTDVWGSEIYATENRYGRYLSYGSATLLGYGDPVSEKASGYVQEGWDWNRIPGTTTVHLPFDLLDSPRPGSLMEKNASRFPGASSLEGRNGVLAFTYVESDRPNFCAGATATKSIFCFDNRIVFLGSGITNTSSYPTETTLFQLALEGEDEGVGINRKVSYDFPFEYRQDKHGKAVVYDTKGNTYIIKDGYGVNVVKQSQTSPLDTKKGERTGNFVSAYIDHGSAPQEATYEYLMLIRPSDKERDRYSKKLPYTVIRQDNVAHVVNDHETGITAYICYSEYSSEDSKEGFAALSKVKGVKPVLEVASIDGETIVMERTVGDGKVVMSVCTPDLGITDKSMSHPQPSRPLMRRVVIEGDYSLAEASDKVSLSNEDGRTVLSVICMDGQPTEFHLTRR